MEGIYAKELNAKCKGASPGESVVVKSMVNFPHLVMKLDKCLQEFITSMHSRGGLIETTVAIGGGILLKHDTRVWWSCKIGERMGEVCFTQNGTCMVSLHKLHYSLQYLLIP